MTSRCPEIPYGISVVPAVLPVSRIKLLTAPTGDQGVSVIPRSGMVCGLRQFVIESRRSSRRRFVICVVVILVGLTTLALLLALDYPSGVFTVLTHRTWMDVVDSIYCRALYGREPISRLQAPEVKHTDGVPEGIEIGIRSTP